MLKIIGEVVNLIKDISIIIPVGPNEQTWRDLLSDLSLFHKDLEIFLIGPENPKISFGSRVKWISSQLGRGLQLNIGASVATKRFLWFLHADSRLTLNSIPALISSLKRFPNALHYFKLKFLPDGPRFMFLNEIGCFLRSRIFKIPFGDQGFCVSKEIYKKIGGFPEDVAYGEDHLFVWRAKQKGIRLHSIGAALKTSARRYTDIGWSRLTLKYAYLWTRQALPELKRL